MSARVREQIDGALCCGRRNEHLAIERIERSARAVEAKAAFAELANNDAGYFMLRAVDGIAFGHRSSIAEITSASSS